MSGFSDPITAGNILIRPAIQSPNYVAGTSGWTINRDGSAEFNSVTVRGSLIVSNGNKYVSILAASGPGASPSVNFDPDSTVFSYGYVGVNVGSDAARADMFVTSPVAIASGVACYSYWSSSSPTTPYTEHVDVADIVRSTAFSYQGSATRSLATAPSATVAPGGTLTLVSRSMTAVPNGYYRIEASWHGLIMGTPVAFPGNVITMSITRDGNVIRSQRILPGNTVKVQEGSTMETKDQPGAGAHTYALVILHEATSTAANVSVDGSATSPISIAVDGFQL